MPLRPEFHRPSSLFIHLALDTPMFPKLIALAIAASVGASITPVAQATSIMDPVVSNSVQVGAGSIRINGTLNDTGTDSRPWTAEFYAGFGECVRFAVATQTFDSAITLITPNGQLYRDDDGNGSLRPLVRMASAPVSGWYTVQVAHYYAAPTVGDFVLQYGRYPAGNINCLGAEAALVGEISITNKPPLHN